MIRNVGGIAVILPAIRNSGKTRDTLVIPVTSNGTLIVARFCHDGHPTNCSKKLHKQYCPDACMGSQCLDLIVLYYIFKCRNKPSTFVCLHDWMVHCQSVISQDRIIFIKVKCDIQYTIQWESLCSRSRSQVYHLQKITYIGIYIIIIIIDMYLLSQLSDTGFTHMQCALLWNVDLECRKQIFWFLETFEWEEISNPVFRFCKRRAGCEHPFIMKDPTIAWSSSWKTGVLHSRDNTPCWRWEIASPLKVKMAKQVWKTEKAKMTGRI